MSYCIPFTPSALEMAMPSSRGGRSEAQHNKSRETRTNPSKSGWGCLKAEQFVCESVSSCHPISQQITSMARVHCDLFMLHWKMEGLWGSHGSDDNNGVQTHSCCNTKAESTQCTLMTGCRNAPVLIALSYPTTGMPISICSYLHE